MDTQPQADTTNSQHLDRLLNDQPPPDHLCERPGKKRRLNKEYTIQMLKPTYNSLISQSESYGYHIPDFHDPDKHKPWSPSGAESSLSMAHDDHKARHVEALEHGNPGDAYDDQRQQPSWVRRKWADRLNPCYAARMRVHISGRAEFDGLVPSTVASVSTESTIIEPLRKIILHPNSGLKPVGNSLQGRRKVFWLAQGLRNYCLGEPAGIVDSSLPSERPLQPGEEYDILDGDFGKYNELEKVFDGPDAPIGAWDSAEVDYYHGRQGLKMIAEMKSGGFTDQSIEDALISSFRRGKTELLEAFETAKADLISRGKLIQ